MLSAVFRRIVSSFRVPGRNYCGPAPAVTLFPSPAPRPRHPAWGVPLPAPVGCAVCQRSLQPWEGQGRLSPVVLTLLSEKGKPGGHRHQDGSLAWPRWRPPLCGVGAGKGRRAWPSHSTDSWAGSVPGEHWSGCWSWIPGWGERGKWPGAALPPDLWVLKPSGSHVPFLQSPCTLHRKEKACLFS